MKKYLSGSVCGGLWLSVIFIFIAQLSVAQIIYEPKPLKKDPPRPKNLKVISEEPDGKGNIVRVIQYDQGSMRVTETVIMPKSAVQPIFAPVKLDPATMRITEVPTPKAGTVGAVTPVTVKIEPDREIQERIRTQTLNKDSLLVFVDKTNYRLMVFYGKKMIRAYKATFGPRPQLDKCMEGDRCTPEGWFKITGLNPKSKYNKFMRLSYPTDSTRIRFNRLKAEGLIPASARIGGDIGIHGIWPGGDDMIELGVGWTDGCVALKNKDIEDLYSIVGVGTRVYIKK